MTGLCGCLDWMLCMAAPADLFLQGREHCSRGPALSGEGGRRRGASRGARGGHEAGLCGAQVQGLRAAPDHARQHGQRAPVRGRRHDHGCARRARARPPAAAPCPGCVLRVIVKSVDAAGVAGFHQRDVFSSIFHSRHCCGVCTHVSCSTPRLVPHRTSPQAENEPRAAPRTPAARASFHRCSMPV